MNTTPRTGVVAKWVGTIGRIDDDETGEPLFTHYSYIVPIPGRKFRVLVPGQRVSFHVEQAPRGPVAVEVRVLADQKGVRHGRR
jgi:cold shock CspA family protein